MSIEHKFSSILQKASALDTSICELSKGKIGRFFNEVSLKITFSSPEATFIRLTSFLYVLLHEGQGKINYEFAVDKFTRFGFDQNLGTEFKRLCQCLRTVLQHNLLLDSSIGSQKINFYKDWLVKNCGKENDLVNDDWIRCCEALLKSFESIIDYIQEILSRLSNDEFRNVIISDWVLKLSSRNYSLHDYCQVSRNVFEYLGLKELDEKKFCQRHFSKWLSELELLDKFLFSDYAKKQIERDILVDFDNNRVYPITGDDIITELGIKPGFEVKRALEKAATLYKESPCNREELLSKLNKLITTK